MLKQVALEIAEKLIALAAKGSSSMDLLTLGHELRGAAKAAPEGGQYEPPPLRDVIFGPPRKSSEEILRDLEAKREVNRAERADNQTFAQGGPADGLVVSLDPDMPVGARTRLDGAVYELASDRKLKFVES
jgi:hypothetical protein